MKVEKIELTEQEMEEMKQQLSDEELGEVAGGFAYIKNGPFKQDRFMFTDEEVWILHERLGVMLTPAKKYTTSDLKSLGIPMKSGKEIKQYLKEQFGFQEVLL